MVSGVLACVMLFAFPIVKSYAANPHKYGDYRYEILKDGTIEIVDYVFPTYDVDHLVIPETMDGYTVSSIGSQAFSSCSATTIVIPDSVTVIKRFAFDGCGRLKSVKLPSNLKSIGYYAFGGARQLQRIEFPDGLLEIDENAFSSCVSVDTLIIPDSLQKTGWAPFEGNKDIKNVYYKGTKEEWDALNFFASNVGYMGAVHCEFDLQHGDVNGDGMINMLDALYVYASVSGQKDLEPVYLMLSDINGDAKLNTLDSLELYRQVS